MENGEGVHPMVGRRVLKMLKNTVCSGWVHEHKPSQGDKEEMWVLHWDDDGEDDQEVNRGTLDKRLNLQSVKEREFSQKKVRLLWVKIAEPPCAMFAFPPRSTAVISLVRLHWKMLSSTLSCSMRQNLMYILLLL